VNQLAQIADTTSEAMIYTFRYQNAVLEFVQNRGRAFVTANDPEQALHKVRELFSPTRDEAVRGRKQGEYIVDFKVGFGYRVALLRTVERALKLLKTAGQYDGGRFIDRYIVATLCKSTGKPSWLAERNIKEEIRALRRAAVVAREVSNVMRFVDWDIVIHNYLELNTRKGHRSRVVRKTAAPASV
jgi:hypothetical protein